MEEDKDFISLELPMELSVRARTQAGKLNISRSELVRQAIEQYLIMLLIEEVKDDHRTKVHST